MILLLVTLAQWSTGFLLLGRLRGCRNNPPHQSITGEQLSVIIPARNEEANLPRLLRSLTTQSVQPSEIIVMDDHSTDQTAAIAQAHGAHVIASPPLPDGWRGKTWACHQGALAATGSRFLFLDADTWFEADGLSQVLAEFSALGGGAFSIAPFHKVQDFYEQFSACFNLIMHASTGAFTMLGDGFRRQNLLGQFLLIDRAAYEKVGGHETVKNRILENFWLSQSLRSAHVPLHCRSGRGVFSFRMYPGGWRQLIEGWTKGFAGGAGQTPRPILLLIIVWLGGLFSVPIDMAVAGRPLVWLPVYGLCVLQIAWMLRRIGTFRWSTALFYPVFMVFFFVVFARSVRRSGKTVTWKGRTLRAG
jgi:4,4'-diaponeurosporenoate glycosyltransferase